MHARIPKPRLVAFEVTRRCRLNCRHCRANACPAGSAAEFSTDQCKKVLDSVAAFGKCIIILTGGEPMERSDIYELIEYGAHAGLRMAIASCGYPIDEVSAGRLKQAGVLTMSLSLDGACAETHDAFRRTEGAFDMAVRAAKIARASGIRFQINTTITTDNVSRVSRIAELAESLGACCFNPFVLVPTARAAQLTGKILKPAQYETLLKQLLEMKLNSGIEVRLTCGPQFLRICRQSKLKQLTSSVSGCMGGRGFGFISCTGDVQACGFLDISAGNMVANGFDFGSIWTESEFLNQLRDISEYNGKCGICEYAELCRGCRARSFTMTGDYLASDPLCSYQPTGRE